MDSWLRVNVLSDLNVANDRAAVNSLNAFINGVRAQRGRGISEPDADALIASAEALAAVL